MIPDLRRRYNADFTDEKYAAFLRELNRAMYWPPDFRVAESPLFLDAQVTSELLRASDDIVAQLATPGFRRHASDAIPAGLSVPGENEWPHFLAVDFALCADGAGGIIPQLIELQGFPTVACWQVLLANAYRRHFPAVPADFTTYFGGLDEERYLGELRAAMVGDALPENVVLLEITPEQQKTRVDFACTHSLIGVRPMCVTKVIKRGRKLFYHSGGREVNRVIFDELLRKNPPMRFSFFDDLDVQWAGHPNWYYRISKHSLPFIRSKYAPACHRVRDVLNNLPADLERYVLKPLYSFAGLGVDISPTREKVMSLQNPSVCADPSDAGRPGEGRGAAHLRRRWGKHAATGQ
jgi:hypothetical protein